MRKLLGAVLTLLLIPVAVAAQKPVSITADQARTAALARVRSDLAAGTLKAWGDEGGRPIRPATLAARADQVDDIHKHLYVVAVTAPNARGHVRVVMNRSTGAVLSSRLASWDWGNSPSWWAKGLDAAPVEKKGEDTLSAKPKGGDL